MSLDFEISDIMQKADSRPLPHPEQSILKSLDDIAATERRKARMWMWLNVVSVIVAGAAGYLVH